MKKNCFIITSTLYSTDTCFDVETRFNQTMDTIKCIKEKDPNCYILFIDNSHIDVSSFFNIIREKVDKAIAYEHNLVSLYYNIRANKSMGELILMHKALEELMKIQITFDRVFKISGRYILNENFSIDEYKNAPRKIIGTLRKWIFYDHQEKKSIERISFETALWSFPYEELNNIRNVLLMNSYDVMIHNDINLENTFFHCIPHEILEIKTPIGLTTIYSHNGEIAEF